MNPPPPPPMPPSIPPPPPPPMPGTAGAKAVPSWKDQQTETESRSNKASNSKYNGMVATPLAGLDPFTQQQYANLPDKLLNTMGKEKKPFTYTPLAAPGVEKGKLDLSEIRSPRMKKRIMANLQENVEPTENSPNGIGRVVQPAQAQPSDYPYGQLNSNDTFTVPPCAPDYNGFSSQPTYSSSSSLDPMSSNWTTRQTGSEASPLSKPRTLVSQMSMPQSANVINPYQPCLPKPFRRTSEYERNISDQLDDLNRSLNSNHQAAAWRPVTSPVASPVNQFQSFAPKFNATESFQRRFETNPNHNNNFTSVGRSERDSDDSIRILRNISDGIQAEMDKLSLAEQAYKQQLDNKRTVNSEMSGYSFDRNNNYELSDKPVNTEPRYTGSSIPSRSFEILKKMTAYDEPGPEVNYMYDGNRPLSRSYSQAERSAPSSPYVYSSVPASQQNHPSTPPVYLGQALPSKSFKLLQMMIGEQPVYNASFSSPFRDYTSVYSPHGTEI